LAFLLMWLPRRYRQPARLRRPITMRPSSVNVATRRNAPFWRRQTGWRDAIVRTSWYPMSAPSSIGISRCAPRV